jgi:hypothetical protein
MARWKASTSGPIEAPEWYRVYHPEAWDEPDEQERRMLAGCTAALGSEWMADRHRWHAERRWHEAQHAYRQAHPAFSEQEFRKIIEEHFPGSGLA